MDEETQVINVEENGNLLEEESVKSIPQLKIKLKKRLSRPRSKSSKSKQNKRGRKSNKLTDDDSTDPQGEDGEFVVEKIMAKRMVEGRIEYHIKWKGWSDADNTWEPIDHLNNCHEMITKYEEKHGGPTPKKKSSRGRRPSSTTSTETKLTSLRPKRNTSTLNSSSLHNGFGNYDVSNGLEVLLDYKSDEEFSDVEEEDVNQDFKVLFECPENSEVQKIHAVAVVDGYLSFLVQWKEKALVEHENGFIEGEKRPKITMMNGNIVRATAMNEKFPQQVIDYYQNRVQFNVSLNTQEEEAKNATRALLLAKEREAALAARPVKKPGTTNDDVIDPATAAIEKEERKKNRFNTHASDLSSSSESDGLNLSSDDD